MRVLLAAGVATGCGSGTLGGPSGNGGAGGGRTGAGGSAGTGGLARDATSTEVRDAAVPDDGPGCVGAATGDCVDGCTVNYARLRVCQGGAWTCPSPSFPVSTCWSGDAAPQCGGSPAYCLPNGVGGGCYDVVPLAVCTAAGWACPGATYPSLCACIGGAYLCDAGIPDAIPGDARPVDAAASDGSTDGISCDGAPVHCVVETGGTCSDFGGVAAVCTPSGWVCPGGSIPFSQCRCVGAPSPGCVCGSNGFVCSDGGQ